MSTAIEQLAARARGAGMNARRYDAVLFDLLSALLDSWTLWTEVAGDPRAARRWREQYLALTYSTGRYAPYESLVARAAEMRGPGPGARAAADAGV